jgi:NitT/TauT family transport system permease protein
MNETACDTTCQTPLTQPKDSAPRPSAGQAAASSRNRGSSKSRRRPLSLLALRQDIPVWLARALGVFSFVALIGAWFWISHQSFINPVFLPTPEDVWSALQTICEDSTLYDDLKVSAMRVTAGFLLSALIALPVGVFIGSYKGLEALCQPATEFIRYIPVPALIPLVMVCCGIGELAKVVLIFIGTFFQLTLMVADEVRRVHYDLVQVSYTLGAKRREVMELVLWRAAMPGIFDALRLCNGWAWTYLMVAELCAANEGLGYRVLKFSRFLQTPRIFLYLLLLGLIGLLLDIAFRTFNKRAFHWADTTKK